MGDERERKMAVDSSSSSRVRKMKKSLAVLLVENI
jgi:hypothetical protein